MRRPPRRLSVEVGATTVDHNSHPPPPTKSIYEFRVSYCAPNQVAGSPPPMWGAKTPAGRSFGKDKDKDVRDKDKDKKGAGGKGGAAGESSVASGGRGTGSTAGIGRFGMSSGKKMTASPRRHSSSGSTNGKFPAPPPPGAALVQTGTGTAQQQ